MEQAFRVFIAFALLLANALDVLAEDNETLQFFEAEAEVITASKRAEKLSDAPATVVVISKEDIRVRGYSNLKDVLRDLPGMETVENYFSEQGTLVPVRGVIGNNKIIVLVNGMRVNPPGGEEMMFRSDFDVREAERIEVVYGAGSTLYGNDAISAVINVITKQPQLTRDASVNLSVGSRNLIDGGAAFSQKWRSLGFTGYAQYLHSDLTDLSRQYPAWWQLNQNIAQPKGSGTPPKRWDEGFNGFMRIAGKDNSLQVWHRESSRSSAEGGYTGVLGFTNEAVWEDRTTAIEGKNRYDVTESFDLESSLTYSRYEISPRTRYVFPANNSTWFLNDFKYGVGHAFSWEERGSWRPSDRLNVLGGIILSDLDILPKATIPGGADPSKDIASQGGAFTYFTRAGDPTSRVDVPRANNVKYQQYGAYLESHWRASESIDLILGGRVDANTRYNTLPFSPRAALIYRAGDQLTVKYIYTRAFVSPAPYFAYNVFDNGTALNTSNPALQPEKSQSHEINLTFRKERFRGVAAVYASEASNLIIVGDRAIAPNIVNPRVFVDLAGTQPRVLTQSANGGRSKSKGFDLYSSYAIGPASFWTSYSYVDFKTDFGQTALGLDQISRHNVRWGMTYAVGRSLWITPSLVYRSTPENVTNTQNLEGEIKNPYEVNAYVLYEPVKALRLFANFRNITNNRYALRGVLGPTPQETFNVAAGAQFRY